MSRCLLGARASAVLLARAVGTVRKVLHMSSTRRAVLVILSALVIAVVPTTAAFARPTPTQFASMMQKALLAKASTYHLTKTQINTAFKNQQLRANLYNAGAIICQKLATETAAKASADLVGFTKTLSSGGQPVDPSVPSPAPKLSTTVIKGVVGVGLTVATAKGSLCPNQAKKAAATLKIYNKAVGAKAK